ncbi:uncharacterized protein LOC126199493 [Schistocerca nitens]|uniref:uncharacterized protein LOC126199493 n=1 Tax=Schistocerca nitens TaxID=7011 RepID=UPI0021190A66|nr:uncharacterized protein LOC126199493 [Schistocerca nitens]
MQPGSVTSSAQAVVVFCGQLRLRLRLRLPPPCGAGVPGVGGGCLDEAYAGVATDSTRVSRPTAPDAEGREGSEVGPTHSRLQLAAGAVAVVDPGCEFSASGRRVSKVKTLRRAIDYIRQLQLQLQLHAAGECLHPQRPDVDDDVSTSPWTRIPDCCELQTSDKENSTSGHQLPPPQQCQYTVPRQENSDTDKVCATGNYLQGLDCDLDGLLRGCYHHQLL